ncbi:MAG: hypothetical protein PCFJNLEI_02055 [Verrucomicrobiae bacterium]|nr:hypothetical protein [Verrucomicrobiae bacterium]
MRLLLTSILSALVLLTIIAQWLKPAPPQDGKTPLVWVSDNNPERQRQITTFNQLHPDLRLNLDPNNTGLQKVIVQSSSGVGPDLCDSYSAGQLQTLVDTGIAWDITEPAAAQGFAMADKVWPGAAAEISYNGRQYSYPCNVNVDILIYNKNIFDRFGVPYPRADMTWDEFVTVAKQVTRLEQGGRDAVYGVTGLSWLHFFAAERGEFFSPDGTRLLMQGTPLRAAFQRHHDLLHVHRVSPTSLDITTMSGQGGWGAGNINLFADGRFAMVTIGKWVLIRLRGAHADQLKRLARWEANPARNPAERPVVLRLGSVPLPCLPGRSPSYLVGSRSAVVNARSTRRTDAVQFLKYLSGPEYSRLINEGVDALPGNPAHVNLGLREGVPDLAELEMHSNTVAAIQSGFGFRKSPFLLTSDVERLLKDAVNRMETSPTLPVTELLADVERSLIGLMQRNLNRDPALRARYRELTGTADVAAAHREPAP